MFVAGLLLSPNFFHLLKAMAFAGEGAIAEYRLRMIPPERYAEEIATALETGDGDMARSLMALAADQKVKVPEVLVARVAALPGVDLGNVLGQGWNCVVNGDFDSEAGFACVVATDLTSIGDVRDLVTQGGNYLTGQPINYFALGISSVGLTLTGATLATGGAALPLRVGASFLKAVNKAGKLPPRLAAQIGGALARSFNTAALDEAMVLAREFRWGELQRPLSRLFNPRSVGLLTDVATDFGRIGKVGGVRAMKLSAEAADSARDVKVLAKTAEKYQGRFPAVMKMLGRGVVRFADLLWTLMGWLIAALLWVIGLGVAMTKIATRVVRLSGRLLRRRPAIRAAPGPIAVPA